MSELYDRLKQIALHPPHPAKPLVGHCATCREWQAKGIKDYCCVGCVARQAGLGDYMTKQPGGTTIIDLAQKARDEAQASRQPDHRM